jgi:hypothetical protein
MRHSLIHGIGTSLRDFSPTRIEFDADDFGLREHASYHHRGRAGAAAPRLASGSKSRIRLARENGGKQDIVVVRVVESVQECYLSTDKDSESAAGD